MSMQKMQRWLNSVLEKQHAMREHRLLRWMGPAVHHPRLWRVTRQGVALGLAIGFFFGFMVPFGQIFCAAILSVMLRANIPVAAAATLVSNPFTFGPIYYGAYCLGDRVLALGRVWHGHPAPLDPEVMGWLGRVADKGLPLLLGLLMLACVLSVTAYYASNWYWRLRVKKAWRLRRQARPC